jgi:hypothetical protein
MIWSPPIFETKTCQLSLGLIGEAAPRMTEQRRYRWSARPCKADQGAQSTRSSSKKPALVDLNQALDA